MKINGEKEVLACGVEREIRKCAKILETEAIQRIGVISWAKYF